MATDKTFTDTSTPGPSGPITAWDLDFGDGSAHGTGPGPWVHSYDDGNYAAELQVTGTPPDGTDSVIHSVIVASGGGGGGGSIPKAASIQQNSGESWSQAVIRGLGYGFDGAVRYFPTAPSWDSQFASLASAKGSDSLNLQVTAKQHTAAGLQQILDNLPDAWRPGFIYNIFQEPEDNWHNGQFSAATYKGWYASAAATIASYNAANPSKAVSGPWVEWQEWSLDPSNGQWDLSQLVPASGDFDGVLWSFYEYGQSAGGVQKAPPNDRIDAMVTEITNFMSAHTPGKNWGIMAGAYTLEPYTGPFTDTQLLAQAAWMQKMYDSLKTAGMSVWGWWNFQFAGTGGAAGESRVEKNLHLLSTLAGLS